MSRPTVSGREARLAQVIRVDIDRHDALGAPPLHRDRIKAAVAADIEHRLAAEVCRQCMREAVPFDRGVIAEEVIGSGGDPAEIDVMKPRAQGRDGRTDFVEGLAPAGSAGHHGRFPAAVGSGASPVARGCTWARSCIASR
jgi:hypothetical protein